MILRAIPLFLLRITLIGSSGCSSFSALTNVSQRGQTLSMQSTVTKSIDSLVELVNVAMCDDTSRYFKEYYCNLLAVRLLHGGCSINAEKLVLHALPRMPMAFQLLRDAETAGSYTLDFRKVLMNRIDEGEAAFSNQVIDLVFQSAGSYLGINVIPAATWPVNSSYLTNFCNLKLPADLARIQEEFELFYSSLPFSWSAEEVDVIKASTNLSAVVIQRRVQRRRVRLLLDSLHSHVVKRAYHLLSLGTIK